jgi:hypothetical protein
LLGAKDMLKNIKYIQFEHWHEKTKMITDLLTENNFTVKELGGNPMNGIAINKNG